jgi:prophage DNA circulation protein
MAAFDRLKRASFAGLEFPVEEVSIDGGLRDHVHEYPHAPGGAPELLGRKLYSFRMRAKFHNTLLGWPADLYPRRWNRLRNICEAGKPEELVVPTLGMLTAYAVNWPETMTARQRSGVTVEFTFREYVDTLFLNGLLDVTAPAAVEQAQQRLAYVTERYRQTPPGQVILEAPPTDPLLAPNVPPPDAAKQDVLDLLGALDDAFNALLAIDDQADFYNTQLDLKIQRIISLSKEVASRAPMQDARNARLRQATLAAWAAADDRRRDIERKRERVILYVTPLDRMSVHDVSRAVYGDQSRAVEILRLNALRDPFNIPRESALRMYRPEPRAAA